MCLAPSTNQDKSPRSGANSLEWVMQCLLVAGVEITDISSTVELTTIIAEGQERSQDKSQLDMRLLY